MTRPLTDDQVLEAVRRLERGRGGLSFASRENRDRVFKMATYQRLPVYRTSAMCLIDDHYVYDLFAADLGIANQKSFRKLYHVTVGIS